MNNEIKQLQDAVDSASVTAWSLVNGGEYVSAKERERAFVELEKAQKRLRDAEAAKKAL